MDTGAESTRAGVHAREHVLSIAACQVGESAQAHALPRCAELRSWPPASLTSYPARSSSNASEAGISCSGRSR